jgi:hypothetical protein
MHLLIRLYVQRINSVYEAYVQRMQSVCSAEWLGSFKGGLYGLVCGPRETYAD